MMAREAIQICEVGPRDGLQDEARSLPLITKIEFVQRLAAAGERVIEVGAFVSPKAVPQMSDSADLLRALTTPPLAATMRDRRLPVLVPNASGLDDALAAGARDIAVFTGVTDSFVQNNIHCSVAESLARFAPLVQRARDLGLRVRGYVSVVFGCPYEGKVPVQRVIDVVETLAQLGCDDLSLGDTIGVATPTDVKRVMTPLIRSLGAARLAGHFHDTRGQALANVRTCLELGLRSFDASVSGLGGCPYAPGSPGNVATEGVVALLEEAGFDTGIDIQALADAGRFIRAALTAPQR
ncbi:MAG: hydroxymethylglutaryl-CoA lyase [Steroidobacteraceae bacterium]